VTAPTTNDRAAAFDASQTTLVGVSNLTLVVGEASTFVIDARNIAGMLMNGGGVAFNVVLTGPLSGNSSVQRTSVGRVVDNADGSYAVTVVPVGLPGVYTLDVRAVGTSASIAPAPLSVNVQASSSDAGQLSGNYTTASGAGLTHALAGALATFTVRTRDAYDVPLASGGQLLTGNVSVAGLVVPIEFADNNDGTYTASYVLPADTQGAFNLVVAAQQLDGSELTLVQSTVQVVTGGTAALSVPMSMAAGRGLVLAVMGVPATFTVTLHDATGALYVAPNTSVQAFVGGPGIAGSLAATVVDNSDGTYTVSYTTPATGTYTVRVAVAGTELPMSPYTVISVTPAQAAAVNATSTTTTTTAPMMLVQQAVSPTYTAAPVKLMAAGIAADTPSVVTKLGAHATFTLHSLAAQSGLRVRVALASGAHTLRTLVHDNADGSYAVQFDATAVGTYAGTVFVNDVGTPTPLAVIVHNVVGEGVFDVSQCVAYGSGLAASVVRGAVVELGVLARDLAGMPLEHGGETFAAHFVPLDGDSGAFTQVLTDNGDGTYTARYELISTSSSQYVITLEHVATRTRIAPTPMLTRVTAAATTASVRVLALAKATLSGDGLAHAVTGRTASFTIVTRDTRRVALLSGGVPMRARLVGPVDVDAHVLDNGDGTYTVTYQLARAGRYVLSVTSNGAVVGSSARYVLRCVEWMSATHSTLVGAGAVGPVVSGE
jgi:hypothetical protein